MADIQTLIQKEEAKLKALAEIITASFPSTIDMITAAKWKNKFKVQNNTVANIYGLIDYSSTTEKEDIIAEYKQFIYIAAGVNLAKGKTEIETIQKIVSYVNMEYDGILKLNFRPYSE